MQRWLLLSVFVSACATHTPGPFFGDEAYLRFGADPRAEAEALINGYAEQNEVVSLRLDGQHFTALGFMTRSGRATRVRVLTDRGIQLALDPDSDSDFALLAAPIADTHDADADGFEEVFIERRTTAGNCLEVYRVGDVGFVDVVPISLPVFGAEFCATAVSDLDHDGRAELLVELELSGFENMTPHLRLALWPSEHRYTLNAKPEALDQLLATEQRKRVTELADARRRFANRDALQIAVELAALAHVRGRSAAEQVAELDHALAGLVLDEAQQHAALRARSTIFEQWNPPRPSEAELVHHADP